MLSKLKNSNLVHKNRNIYQMYSQLPSLGPNITYCLYRKLFKNAFMYENKIIIITLLQTVRAIIFLTQIIDTAR